MVHDADADTAEFHLPLSGRRGKRKPSELAVRPEVAARSHPGSVRDSNEDRYLMACLARSMRVEDTNLEPDQLPARHEEEAQVLVVADGMGGHAAGEMASTMAISVGTRLVLDNPRWALRIDEREARRLVEKASRYFEEIDEAIARRGRSDPALFGMGTTLTIAYCAGVNLFVFHVGDSRAYLYREGTLRRLTRDQTVAQALADSGQIAPEEVSTHRLRHVLTRALGGRGGQARAEIQHLTLAADDQLLLCTDGLSDMVPDDAVAETLAGAPDAEAACERLVERALEAGGEDNITVVLARFSAAGKG
jgi:serine/threonine protein phosphatase PrpC